MTDIWQNKFGLNEYLLKQILYFANHLLNSIVNKSLWASKSSYLGFINKDQKRSAEFPARAGWVELI